MNKRAIILLPFVLALSACGWSHYSILEEKLEGKTQEQKRLTLAEECRIEIKKGLIKDDPKNVKQHKLMQQICEEMTGQSVSVEY